MAVDFDTLERLALRTRVVSEDEWRECANDPDATTGEQMLRLLERKAYLTPWQAARLAKGETDGYFLGGYRLLYMISAGTFGRVFRADNPQTGEVVAVKVLRKKWSSDPHKVELFEREGKVGMTLNHRNIVRILSVSKDPASGQHYIVMEFVEGGNLRDILNIRKKLDADHALKVLEEAALGLAYSYANGLTHRDIKPTNILVTTQGDAKLVDFGLADGGDDDDTEVERTVDYAGLEKLTGAPSGDVRSDIYFLGAVAFETLTGRPYLTVTKDARARMARQRFEMAYSQLKADDPDLPGPVLTLLKRLLALTPSERVQTPVQMAEAVKEARRNLAAGASADDGFPPGIRTVFVIEHNEKLQDVFRAKLKKYGYRVLISIDASKAVARYQQQPFHGLIVDAGTTGEEGVDAFTRVMSEAKLQKWSIFGILMLNEDQADWAKQVPQCDSAEVLIRPVVMKQILGSLRERVPTPMPDANDDE